MSVKPFFRQKKFYFLALLLVVYLVRLATKDTPEELERQSQKNLETEIQKITIEGMDFDIPMRHLYSAAMDYRFNKLWPKALEHRQKIDTTQISGLLPDFRPYRKEEHALWVELGPENRRIDASVSSIKRIAPTSRQWFEDYIRRTRESGLTEYQGINSIDLHHFSDNVESVFFSSNSADETYIRCPKSYPPKPETCKTVIGYRTTLTIEFYFPESELKNWKQIRRSVIQTIDQFHKPSLKAMLP